MQDLAIRFLNHAGEAQIIRDAYGQTRLEVTHGALLFHG